MALPVTISGTAWAPNGALIGGPYIDSNGHVYIIVFDSTATQTVDIYKATDPTSSFSQVLSWAISEGQALDSFQVGDTIHIVGVGDEILYYRSFTTGATPAWDASATSASSTGNGLYFEGRPGIVVASDGDIYIAGIMSKHTSMGKGYERSEWFKSTDGGSTWGSANYVSGLSSTRSETDTLQGMALGASDRIHYLYLNDTGSQGQIRHRAYNSSDTGQTDQQIATDANYDTDVAANAASGGELTQYDDEGTTKLIGGYATTGTKHWKVLTATSGDAPTWTVTSISDNAIGSDWLNPGSVAGRADELHALYIRSSDSDIYHDENIAGAGWGTDTNTRTATANDVYGNIFERSGNYVYAFVYDDAGTLKYDEVDLGAAGTTETQTVTGSTTPTGALTLETQHNPAGTTTPTGALSPLAVAHSLAGSTTPTGALTLKTFTSFTGSTTPTGSLVNQTTQTFTQTVTGSTTPTGALTLIVKRNVAGTYLDLPGTTGHYAGLGDDDAYDGGSSSEFFFRGVADDWTPTSNKVFLGKFESATSNRTFVFYLDTAGNLNLLIADASGHDTFTSSTTPQWATDGAPLTVRAVWSSSGTVDFYESQDSDFATASWTAVGTQQTGGTRTTLFNSTASLNIGQDFSSAWAGQIYAARWDIDGTPVMDTDFGPQAPGETSFVEDSTTAATVTLFGSAALVEPSHNLTGYTKPTGAVSFTVKRNATGTYLDLPGTVGHHAEAADDPAFASGTSATFYFRGAADDWTKTSPPAVMFAQYQGTPTSDQNFILYLEHVTGYIVFRKDDGLGGAPDVYKSSVAPSWATDGSSLSIRAIWNGTAGTVDFYESQDADFDTASWTQIGTQQTGGSITSMIDSAAAITIGQDDSSPWAGRVEAVRIDIGGTTELDIDFTKQAVGETSFVEDSANALTVTLFNTAAISDYAHSLAGYTKPTGALTVIRQANLAADGSTTPTGALTLTVQITPAGTTTPTGDLTVVGPAEQIAPTGSTTPTGELTLKVQTTATGTTTPTGALILRTVTTAFTGITTPTGDLTTVTPFLTLTGTTTPTGVLTLRTVTTSFTGITTPTGTLANRPLLAFTGSTTPTGIFTNRPLLAFTGSTTPTGALTVTKLSFLTATGTTTPTGTLTLLPRPVYTGSTTPTGTLTPFNVTSTFTGTTTPVGLLTLRYQDKIGTAGSVTPTGALTLQTFTTSYTGITTPTGNLTTVTEKAPAGTTTPTGAATLQTQTTFAGTSTPTGALSVTQVSLLTVTGTTTPTGTLTLQVNVVTTGTTTPTGTVTHKTFLTATGSTTPTGTLTRTSSITLTGTSTPTGTLTNRQVSLLSASGTSSPAGTLSVQTQTTFTGAVTPTGTLSLTVAATPTGTTTPTGAHQAAAKAIFAGSATPAGVLAHKAFRALAGATTPTGTLTLVTKDQVGTEGQVTPTGTLTLVPAVLFQGTVTPVSTTAVEADAGRTFTGTTTPTGVVVLKASVTYTGSTTPTATTAILGTALTPFTFAVHVPTVGKMGNPQPQPRSVRVVAPV